MLRFYPLFSHQISHIPRHAILRWSGITANRKRGELLPKVYTALGIEVKAKPQKPGFTLLMKKFTNVDPYQRVLCGSRMVLLKSAEAGIRAEELLARRRQEFKIERWLRNRRHRKAMPEIWYRYQNGGYFNQSSNSCCLS
ncbi:hypothetical protein M5G07_01295 [Serratia symbiotica]|nr:hypothetical protein [Serratia symbiotica]